MVRRARQAWHEHGASWRTTALAWASAVLLGAASTLFRPAESQDVLTTAAVILVVTPFAWSYLVGFGALFYSLGLRLDARRWRSARRVANMMLLIGGPTPLVVGLFDWLIP